MADNITKQNLSPNVVLRSDGVLVVSNVRLSYPHLFKPWAKNPEKETPKYSGRFLLDKTTQAEDIKALQKHIKGLMEEYFKGRIKNDALFFRDGGDTGKPEQENMWLIAANEERPPQLLNRNKKPVKESDDLLYAGAYVNVMIRPWKQTNVHGKRINANLLAVQYVKEGERFGAERPDASEAFDEVEGDFEDGAGDASDFGDDSDPFA
jgi:hypothetical protein